MTLKTLAPWKESYEKPRQHIKKQKRRDITLPTNVHTVKVLFFPVILYGCESWSIKKTEYWRTEAFKLWCWKRLKSPLEITSVNPKANQPWIFIGNTDALETLKLQYFGHLMQKPTHWIGAGKDGRQKEGLWQRTRWFISIADAMSMTFSKPWEIMDDRGGWHATYHEVAKSPTQLSDWKTNQEYPFPQN